MANRAVGMMETNRLVKIIEKSGRGNDSKSPLKLRNVSKLALKYFVYRATIGPAIKNQKTTVPNTAKINVVIGETACDSTSSSKIRCDAS